MNVVQGTGTYVGIHVLARTLRGLGVEVEMVTPRFPCPSLTLRRLAFNQYLRTITTAADVTVGFDMDGYTIAGRRAGFHIASIKGVIADEMRFEKGWTRTTMAIQARCEAKHVGRSGLVVTTSAYAAERVQELYGAKRAPRIVPELIDLSAWSALLPPNPLQANGKFVVLTVCRFYPRKRLHVLLAAIPRLRSEIAGLEVRIVGAGPEEARLKALHRKAGLGETVFWLGNISRRELAHEYSACDVFCLPSVQEGFGIVFLEAMASGKPIVAARAGATPEVAPHGLLAKPESADELADAILQLYRNPALRASLAKAGSSFVRKFDAQIVGREFLSLVQSLGRQ
jgi:glycosyltransferase involved in cell wall biosynthesis